MGHAIAVFLAVFWSLMALSPSMAKASLGEKGARVLAIVFAALFATVAF